VRFFSQYDDRLANHGDYDCGVACLRCILDLFRRAVSRDDLVTRCPDEFKKGEKDEGAICLRDLNGLRRIADAFGFVVSDWIEFDSLKDLLPDGNAEAVLIVLRTEGKQHAVVLHDIEEDGKIWIMDPGAESKDFKCVTRQALLDCDPVLLKVTRQ